MFFLLALACEVPQPPPAKVEKPKCELDVTKLGGTAWVYNKPMPAGPSVPDPTARMRFLDEGGATKANYTAGSSSDVFSYDCSVEGKILTCLETDPHLDAFCHASAAVHDGVCDAAEVAAATGAPADAIAKVKETVDAELKKLKGDEIAQQRKSDNNPNNKLRSIFKVAVDPATCGITVQDKYQTMVDGRRNEFENVLGSAKFIKADADYTWESCKDADSAWAPGADDQHSPVQAPGMIKFSAMLQKDQQKGLDGCTLTADIYKDWVKGQAELQSTVDKKWGPRWDTTISFTEPGKHVVYFDRHKTCDGKRERIGTTCAMVRVE